MHEEIEEMSTIAAGLVTQELPLSKELELLYSVDHEERCEIRANHPGTSFLTQQLQNRQTTVVSAKNA